MSLLVAVLAYDIDDGLTYCFVHTILKESVQHNKQTRRSGEELTTMMSYNRDLVVCVNR